MQSLQKVVNAIQSSLSNSLNSLIIAGLNLWGLGYNCPIFTRKIQLVNSMLNIWLARLPDVTKPRENQVMRSSCRSPSNLSCQSPVVLFPGYITGQGCKYSWKISTLYDLQTFLLQKLMRLKNILIIISLMYGRSHAVGISNDVRCWLLAPL